MYVYLEYQEAYDDYKKALELRPSFENIYKLSGRLQEAKKNVELMKSLDKAVERNPKDADVYYKRGLANAKFHNYAGAISDYTKAIELNPKYEDAYHQRGLAKNMLGDYKGSKEDFDKAEELKPDSKEGN